MLKDYYGEASYFGSSKKTGLGVSGMVEDPEWEVERGRPGSDGDHNFSGRLVNGQPK